MSEFTSFVVGRMIDGQIHTVEFYTLESALEFFDTTKNTVGLEASSLIGFSCICGAIIINEHLPNN